MASEFASNIREIAAQIRELDKATATAVRKAIRVTVAEQGKATLDAIKAAEAFSTGKSSDPQKYPRIPLAAATTLKIAISTRSAGAVIAVNTKKAPQARPLEGSPGGRGDGRNRHPVFADKGKSRSQWKWVNQPKKPFFFAPAKAQEQITEKEFIAAVNEACRLAGWSGV